MYEDRELTPPVNVGEELDVEIEAVGEKGDGIARKKGFVLFVQGTKQGDQVRVRVTKVLRKVGFAEVIGKPEGEIVKAGPRRESAAAAEATGEQEEANGQKPVDTDNFGEDQS